MKGLNDRITDFHDSARGVSDFGKGAVIQIKITAGYKRASIINANDNRLSVAWVFYQKPSAERQSFVGSCHRPGGQSLTVGSNAVFITVAEAVVAGNRALV